jgi:cyclophilin family peptidyl-prolyl cis-trans isomerase
MPNTKRDRQRANREAKRRIEDKERRRQRLISTARRWGIIAAIVIGAGVIITLLTNRNDTPEATATTTTSSVAPTTTAATSTTATSTTAATSTSTGAPVFGPNGYEELRAQPVACGGDLPDPVTTLEFTAPEDQGIDAATKPVATIATSCGDLVVELDPSIAPETVNSFAFLAAEGFYDGIAFHRIMPGFMAQAGDPLGTGIGGSGYRLPSEPPTGDAPYERGVIAMAGNAAGPSGSLFFILFEDYPLPPQYNIFGRLVGGLDILDAIGAVPLGLSDGGELSSPLETVYIEGIAIESP